mmetsp:Transcript_10430/g.45290  ORF Transcript_10430/g.45290 Transcript_10430/m.45290 type:complete len:232 (+) Transcript_10430:443-1138(+)
MARVAPVPLPVRHDRFRRAQGDRAQRVRRARRVHRRLARAAPRHAARHPRAVPAGCGHGGEARVPPGLLRLRGFAREPARQGQVPGPPPRHAPDPGRRAPGGRRSLCSGCALHVHRARGIRPSIRAQAPRARRRRHDDHRGAQRPGERHAPPRHRVPRHPHRSPRPSARHDAQAAQLCPPPLQLPRRLLARHRGRTGVAHRGEGGGWRRRRGRAVRRRAGVPRPRRHRARR